MPGGSGRGSPSTRTSTGRPASRTLGDQRVEAGEPGLGRERRALVGHLAQHAEHAPQLGERRAPGLLHRPERTARPLGIGVEHRLGRLRLHHHHAEAVRDHVVHLARQAGALLGHRRPGLALALALEPRGALLQLRRPQVALAEGEPGEPRDGGHRADEHEVARTPVRVHGHDHRDRRP